MNSDRYTASQAATKLGIEEDELRTIVREQRDTLPPRDSRYPNLFTPEFIDALRQFVPDPPPDDTAPPTAVAPSDGFATVLAVTSGKGGVGKTSVSVNIATQLARRGFRTILIDADLGLANAHILAGVKPEHTLWDYIEGRAPLANVIVDGIAGVKFVSGGSGIKEMANLDASGRQRILDTIRQLRPHCDVVILDTAAGVGNSVTDFVSISDQTLVVTTSNFAAIADAYGIIKVLVQDGHQKPMHLIVNRVSSPEEAEQVYKKLRGCAERFLSFDLNWLGLLPEDSSVEGAVLKRTPFTESYPGSVITRYTKRLVSGLERLLPQPATR